ncbi:hypothetical protein [Kitasatospora sp. NPDC093679]|uniref:hypothetical protein n=1 Tax=Kitasatospora sp. NPDC093679 TaxID=3154983 RepID=UPI00343D8D66
MPNTEQGEQDPNMESSKPAREKAERRTEKVIQNVERTLKMALLLTNLLHAFGVI